MFYYFMTSQTHERVKKCSDYHFQIKGSVFTVNFYPSKQTFYVNGAVNKAPIKYNNIEFLINIADGKQELVLATNKVSRKSFKLLKRNILIQAHRNCFVCNIDLTKTDLKEVTIEHKIPLSKGGSNRPDNLAISCLKCNRARKNNLARQ